MVEAPPTPSPTPRASEFFSHPPLPKKEEATLRVLGITRMKATTVRAAAVGARAIAGVVVRESDLELGNLFLTGPALDLPSRFSVGEMNSKPPQC